MKQIYCDNYHKFALLFVGFILLTATTAYAQGCAPLTAFDCATSQSCTLVAAADTQSEFQCRPAANSCESEFQQLVIDPEKPLHVTPQTELSASCEAQNNCEFVAAGSCYCPPLEFLECYCSGGTPPTCQPPETLNVTPPIGRFMIVSARSASDVAHTSEAILFDDVIGNWMEFNAKGLKAEGLGCDAWEILRVDPVSNLNDPILADVMVPPTGGPNSARDARELISFEYICEGESFLSLTKIDDRVLVIPWDNSATYLIAEIPLKQSEISSFQNELKSMKFYDGAITGKMDELTIFAISLWSSYRAKFEDDYRFSRPGITRNLLDTLEVIEGK